MKEVINRHQDKKGLLRKATATAGMLVVLTACDQQPQITDGTVFKKEYVEAHTKRTNLAMPVGKNAGKLEETNLIKRISPIAWRHVNFLGRFEFQKRHNHINIDEVITRLQEEPGWQQREIGKESLEQGAYFTFSGG